MITLILRLLLTVVLLVIVWRHSHWSVALAITLLSVANESHLEVLERFKRGR